MTDTISTLPKRVPFIRQTLRETGVALGGTEPGPVYAGASGSGTAATAAVIEIDKLYPHTKGSISDLVAALALLADAIKTLDEARAAFRNKDFVGSDRYIQHFQAGLPALFMRRKIGDGYAVIINSLHLAFINHRGKPLNSDQLTTVWRVIRELRNAPFVQFEQALLAVEELEKCGLQVDPPIVSELLGDSEDDIEEK
jgi:hypothetical protein